MTDERFPSQKLDQYMLRLPDGMRDRIKKAAEANGRSMNAEIVAALYDWFPDPTPEEYLGWLMREHESLSMHAESEKVLPVSRERAKNEADKIRQRMIDVIDGKVDQSTFAEEIASLSDFHAMKTPKRKDP